MKYLLAAIVSGASVISMVPINSQEPGQDPVRVPPEELAVDDTCLDCHENLLQAKFVHEPVEGEICEACHEQPDEALHTFTIEKNLNATCEVCHEAPVGNHVHKPVADGDCASCHEMHASDHKALLLSEDEEELCISCHKDQLKLDRKYVHDPVDLGMCTICHSPHAAEQEKLLTEDKMDLCLSCHEELSHGLDNAENVHLPADEDCGLCHEVHASDHPSQLLDAAPQLCFECHDDIQTKTELSIGHTAVTSKAGCLNCHAAHHSPHAAMLNGRQSEICLTCHNKALPGKNEKTIASMDDWLNLEFQHGPIQEGNCSSCHDLHGTDVNSLLRASYTKRFYSSWDPFNFALCFRCHEVSAFLDKRSETLTEFRNGDLNLHFSHVNRKRKGHTCRACHETRASASTHNLAVSVPFGAWRMPMGYKHLRNGGSCSPGCHSPREYDRINPVEYEVKERIKQHPF